MGRSKSKRKNYVPLSAYEGQFNEALDGKTTKSQSSKIPHNTSQSQILDKTHVLKHLQSGSKDVAQPEYHKPIGKEYVTNQFREQKENVQSKHSENNLSLKVDNETSYEFKKNQISKDESDDTQSSFQFDQKQTIDIKSDLTQKDPKLDKIKDSKVKNDVHLQKDDHNKQTFSDENNKDDGANFTAQKKKKNSSYQAPDSNKSQHPQNNSMQFHKAPNSDVNNDLFCKTCNNTFRQTALRLHRSHSYIPRKFAELEKKKLELQSSRTDLEKQSNILNTLKVSMLQPMQNMINDFEMSCIQKKILLEKEIQSIDDDINGQRTSDEKNSIAQGSITQETTIPPWLISNFFKDSLGLLLESGKEVYCSLEHDPTKFAPLFIVGDRIHFSCFRNDTTPSADAIMLPYKVVGSSLTLEDLCFMELAFGGSRGIGKIYIHVDSETFSGRQFLLLCTGEKGPSYRNTRFFRSCFLGTPAHHIWGGDHSLNDGSGGETVCDVSDPMDYRPKAICKGLVAARFGYEDRSTIFRIYVGTGGGETYGGNMAGYGGGRNAPQAVKDDHGFGQVVEGMDVLEFVASQSAIVQAKISDVGRVLKLG